MITGQLDTPEVNLYYTIRGDGPVLLILQGGAGNAEGSEDLANQQLLEGVEREEALRRHYHYERVLRETFAVRLARAFTPVDYEVVFGDPEQLSLFARSIGEIRTILTQLPGNALANSPGAPPG